MTKQSKYEEQKIVRNAAKKERNKSHATYHLICFENNNQPRYPENNQHDSTKKSIKNTQQPTIGKRRK